MKKSMRMVSVMMSAVMAMSAMSALAAGASALDFHGPKHNPKTSYTESYDRLSSSAIPVFIHTDGINGRLAGVSVTMDYEFVAKADSSAVREIRAKHPEYFVTVPDINGNVVVHVNEKHTCTKDTGDYALRFDIPANTDLSGMTITLGFDSRITGENELCKYSFTDSNFMWQPDRIQIDLDGQTWGPSYTVTGKISLVNGKTAVLVCNQKA